MAVLKAVAISPTRCRRMSVKRIRMGSWMIALAQFVHELLEVDGLVGPLARVDGDVAWRLTLK